MGIKFDHVQYLVPLRMVLGDASEQIQYTAPFTDKEFFRCVIDPGFSGSIDFIDADLKVYGGVTVIQNVTWKWQAREQGTSGWTDLHTAVTEQWTGGIDTGIRLGLDASALGTGADAVPLELRLILSAPTAATISVSFGFGYSTPAVRIFGESA